MSKVTATAFREGLEERLWDRESDYAMLAQWWWALPDWEPAPSNILPDTGIILSKSGVPICAGFWYFMDNAPVAYVALPVFAPDCPLKLLPTAAKVLFQRLIDRALENGAHQVVNNAGTAALRRIAEEKADMSPNPGPIYTAYWRSDSRPTVVLED